MKLNHVILAGAVVFLLCMGVSNSHAQKKPKLIKAVLANGEFNISTARLNKMIKERRALNLKENLRLFKVVAWQVDQKQRLAVLEKAKQFVAQNGRWMRTESVPLEEARLAKLANILIEDGSRTDPAIVELGALRQSAEQAQAQAQILEALETFTTAHNRLPRTQIVALSGKINHVADMSAEQIAEFKLAHQIEYILEKDPSSAVAQKIRALKENWNK